ncbi:MAG: CinA family protein [Victivallales bacterium]|nr:CinA family protein [Victivallales bacterium]
MIITYEKRYEAAERLGQLLREQGKSLATAESCTGGGIAATITAVPGSSEWFHGALVTYTNQWKQQFLGVAKETLDSYGAVSRQTVSEMLTGLLKATKVDCGIAVSGIAGPGGGTPSKPVGTVFVGVADTTRQVIQECHFDGDREQVRAQTILTALEMLWKLCEA